MTSTKPTTSPFTPGPYLIERDFDGCDDFWHIRDHADNKLIATIPY